MNDGYSVQHHAAERFAQRVMGIAHPKPQDLATAVQLVLAHMDSARTVKRNRDKSRVVSTDDGLHLVVRGGAVITVMTPGLPVRGCRCTHCLAAIMRGHKEQACDEDTGGAR